MKKLKEIWHNAPKWYRWAYWICLFSSLALIAFGVLAPPLGMIDNSILLAVGELFGFASLGVGAAALERGVDATVKHNNTEVTLSNPDGSNKEDGEI